MVVEVADDSVVTACLDNLITSELTSREWQNVKQENLLWNKEIIQHLKRYLLCGCISLLFLFLY